MNTFSGLLSSFVHQKDISVYPMTRYCGIDRTLMYKYLNGKDYPKEQAVVERMGDFMRLSPSEYEDLLTAWKIEKIGWKNWNSRRNVEDFLLNFPDVSRLSESLSLASSGSGPATYPDCRALPTHTALNHVVSQIIMDELQKENGRICLMLQPDYTFLFHLLTGLGEYDRQIPIRHIVCFENTSQPDRNSQDHNLLYLRKILPLYIRALDYSVFYYYDAVNAHFSNLNGLSCLILTSSCAVTCTSDYQTGILYGNPDVVQTLQSHFDSCQEKCSPLFSPIHSIRDTCETVLKFFPASDEYYSLQPEPCLIPFLTPDLVNRIVRTETPERSELLPMLNNFIRQLRQKISGGTCHMFHTSDGIRRFMKTGRIYEIPEELYQPFPPEDRKLLLYRLSQHISGRYSILRGPLENLPQNFHLWVSSANGYLMFTNRKKETIYLLFTESGLLTAFMDYLRNIDEKYLYTDEEARHFMDELLEAEIKS